MTTQWLPILYREFYDIPRMVVVEYREELFLLDSQFDSAVDDYDDEFVVYALPRSATATVECPSWEDLPGLGKRLGRIPTTSVKFDPTKRRAVASDVLKRIHSLAPG